MANAYSTIGVPVPTDEAFYEAANRAAEAGTRIDTARGTYCRLTDGSGAELWAQIAPNGELVGLAPHFAGATRFRVSITEAIARDSDSPLDGAFYSWSIGDDGPGEHGEGDFRWCSTSRTARGRVR
jgi:hypothetical protein